MRRLGDFGQPKLTVEHRFRDFFGAFSHVGFVHDIGDVIAGKGELAGVVPMLVLVNHAAHRVRIKTGEGAVHHHLRDRDLTTDGLAPGLEINRIGKTFFGFAARFLIEQPQAFGRRMSIPLSWRNVR